MISDILAGKPRIEDLFKGSSFYQFESDMGTRALNRQLAARGEFGSCAGLESLVLFDKSLVAGEGNRYFDRLFNVTSLGKSAAAGQAQATTATVNTLADIQMKAGLGVGRLPESVQSARRGWSGSRGSHYVRHQQLGRVLPLQSVLLKAGFTAKHHGRFWI